MHDNLHVQKQRTCNLILPELATAMLIAIEVDGALQYMLGKEKYQRRLLITGFLATTGCAIMESGIVFLIFRWKKAALQTRLFHTAS